MSTTSSIGLASATGAASATGTASSAGAACGAGIVSGAGMALPAAAGASAATPASGRRRFVAGAASLAVGPALLGGCGVFGDGRAKPPPYPKTAATGPQRPRWQAKAAGPGGLGFAPAVTGQAIWVASRASGITRFDRDGGRRTGVVAPSLRLAAGVGADDALLVAITRDAHVVALDPDGTERWRVPVGGESVTPPVVTPEVIVVRTVDSRLIGLDREHGETRWTYQRQAPALVLRQDAPLLDQDGMLLAGLAGGRVASIDPVTGLARWDGIVATPRGATELERLIDIVGQPAPSRSSVCVVAYQGRTACLQREDGRPVWTRDFGSASGIGADRDLVVTVDNSDVIVGLEAATGETRWKQEGYVRRDLTAPAVLGASVFVADRQGSVHRLAAADGSPQSRHPLDSAVVTAPRIVDDLCLVLATDGTLAAFGADA